MLEDIMDCIGDFLEYNCDLIAAVIAIVLPFILLAMLVGLHSGSAADEQQTETAPVVSQSVDSVYTDSNAEENPSSSTDQTSKASGNTYITDSAVTIVSDSSSVSTYQEVTGGKSVETPSGDRNTEHAPGIYIIDSNGNLVFYSAEWKITRLNMLYLARSVKSIVKIVTYVESCSRFVWA